MKLERLIWAGLMTGAALAAAAGYTAAGTAGQTAREPFPAVEETAAALPAAPVKVRAQALAETDAQALFVTVRAGELPQGTILRAAGDGGEPVGKAAVNAQGEGLLELTPGRAYTVWADDGPQAEFYLEDNAAVSNVQGDGWTDGEILYLTEEPRCTLTVKMTVPEGKSAAVTLEGGGVSERRDLSADTGGKAVFAGLAPGTYTLTAGGSSREVTLTAQMSSVLLGLD